MTKPLVDLVLYSVRLFFWIFFRPSELRNHLKKVDRRLTPLSCWLDIPAISLRDSKLIGFIAASYVVRVFSVSFAIWLVLFASGTSAYNIVFGVCLGVGVAVFGGFIGDVAVGFGPGIGGGIIGGMAAGIGYGLVGSKGLDGILATSPGAAIVLNASACLCMGASSAFVFMFGQDVQSRRSIGWHVGVSVIGILVATVVFGTIILAPLVSTQVPVERIRVAICYALAVSAAFFLVLLRVNRGLSSQSVVASLVFLTTACVSIYVAWVVQGKSTSLVGRAIHGMSVGIADGILICMVYAIPCYIGRSIGGVFSGAIAGAVSMAAVMSTYVIAARAQLPAQAIGISLVALSLGLTLLWWRGLCFALIWPAWNIVNLRLDTSRGSAAGIYRNSAFLDEMTLFRPVALAQHLLLAWECDPKLAQSVERELVAIGHAKDVREARFEFAVRQLERCEDLRQIADIASTTDFEHKNFQSTLVYIARDIASSLEQQTSFVRRLTLETVERRLNELYFSLTNSTSYESRRLVGVCSSWQRIVRARVASEFEIAAALGEIRNPYVTTPILEGEPTFVGRGDIALKIEQLVVGARNQPIFLLGERRIGKTSLLHNLGRLLPHSILPTYVDIQGTVSKTVRVSTLLWMLARQMANSLERFRGLKLPFPAREQFEDEPFVEFEAWLDDVCATYHDCSILMQLDEFEALRDFRSNESVVSVLQYLRHIMQHKRQIRLLFASSHGLDELAEWSSYFVNVRTIEISYLTAAEAQKLIEEPIPNFELAFSPAAVERIFQLTSGHPALVQLLCSTIVERRNELTGYNKSAESVSCPEVEDSVTQALKEGTSFYFLDIEKNQAGADGSKYLKSLALQADVVSPYEVDPFMLERLKRRKLIYQHGGQQRFRIELVRRWFASQSTDQ